MNSILGSNNKFVFFPTQEETVAKGQAILKITMKRLNRTLNQRGISPLYLAIVFALLCFFSVYLYIKFHRRTWYYWKSSILLVQLCYWIVRFLFSTGNCNIWTTKRSPAICKFKFSELVAHGIMIMWFTHVPQLRTDLWSLMAGYTHM